MAYSIYPVQTPIVTAENYTQSGTTNGDQNFTNAFYTSLVELLGDDFYTDSIECTASLPISQYTPTNGLATVPEGNYVLCLRRNRQGSICLSFYTNYYTNSCAIACIQDAATGIPVKAISIYGGNGTSTGPLKYKMNVFNVSENIKILKMNNTPYGQGCIVFKDNLIIGGPQRTNNLSVQSASDYTIAVYDCTTKTVLFNRSCPQHQVSDSFVQLANLSYVKENSVREVDGVYYALVVPNANTDIYYLYNNNGHIYVQFNGICFSSSKIASIVVKLT